MSEHYIGRAAEAAARAKHNQIHKVKKTAKRRPAKKSATKAAKAIEEALGEFKPIPINQNALITEEGRKLFEKDVIKAEAAMNTAKELRPDLYFPSPSQIADPDEWTEYGPLGGQDENAIAREVLGMELGIPEETVVAQKAPSEASEPALVQVVPEPSVNAPQALYSEKLGQEPITQLPDGSACFTATIMSREEAMALPLKDRPLNYRISGDMYHAVFEAIGAASMCWNPRPSDEVFSSEEASKVAVDLCFKIAAELEKTNPDAADSIENLIDGLNFLFKHSKKIASKDVEILKARVRKGRNLIKELKRQ